MKCLLIFTFIASTATTSRVKNTSDHKHDQQGRRRLAKQLKQGGWNRGTTSTVGALSARTAALLERRSGNIQTGWSSYQLSKEEQGARSNTLPPLDPTAFSHARQRGQVPCTLYDCEGINLYAAILEDLEPWRRRGGISIADIDAAQKKGCAVGEEDAHFFDCVRGWVRVIIVNGTLWATHAGEGFGTRDGVFLVALLELLARYKSYIPDVDFVLQPGDRAKILKVKHPQDVKVLPLLLSFAVHPDYMEVGIPDPSFWGWPEMGIAPHAQLLRDPDVIPWKDKRQVAFWRGGSHRRFGGHTRKRLLECPAESTPAMQKRLDVHDAMRLAAVKNISKPRECKSACQEWVGPMAHCRTKFPVFAQGEGYTSSKQRVLACGSLPVFLSHDEMDSYFGRWLVENKHYKNIRPESVCDDLKRVVWWAVEHDEAAQRIGVNARRFATRVLSEHMVHLYLLAMLQEISKLMTYPAAQAWHNLMDAQRRGVRGPAAGTEGIGGIGVSRAHISGKDSTLQRAPHWASTGSKAAIAAAFTPVGQPRITVVEAAASGTLTKFTPATIVPYFATKEGRKAQMVEIALKNTRTAVVPGNLQENMKRDRRARGTN